MLSIASTDVEKVTVVSKPKREDGSDGALDGPLRVTLIDGDAGIEQDAGAPLQFKAVSGAPGVSHFSVKGDRDLDPLVDDLLEDSVEYTVTAFVSPVSSLGLEAGAVEPK